MQKKNDSAMGSSIYDVTVLAPGRGQWFYGYSTKFFVINGVTMVEGGPELRDIIYGRPLSWDSSFRNWRGDVITHFCQDNISQDCKPII